MSSTLEKIETLEQEAKKGVELATRALHTLDILAHRQIAMEQSSASLGKLVSALSKALVTKRIVSDEEIMKGLQEIEVENDKIEVAKLLEANIIKPSEKVGPHSYLVASVVSNDEKVNIPYRLFKMGDVATALPEFAADVQDKVAGETVPVKTSDDAVLTVTVLEVYDFTSTEA